MTAEICIMNKTAVTLAADSAMTVRRWVKGEEEVRYFKGTNKIFEVSNFHPVGAMIFGSAEIQRVPWELIIKDFRRSLGDRSFNDVSGYAFELFNYMQGHPQLFPAEYQDEVFYTEAD